MTAWTGRPRTAPAIEASFDAALAAETVRWIPITTLRPQDAARALANRVAARAAAAPATMDWAQPAARLVADEVAAITRAVLHAPPGAPVLLTAGGTESNLMALLAARAQHPRGTGGAIVAGQTAHPCIAQAAHLLGLRLVSVAAGKDGRTPAPALARAITADTVAVVASLPTDCHGVCDDAAAIGQIAAERGLWLHLDACLGGWLLPFMRAAGHDVTAPDFRLPGVHSISADLHKYGYAPIGISTLVIRTPAMAAGARFEWDDWPGPAHVSERLAGTRSIDALAGAWAALSVLGAEGMLARARAIIANMAAFAAMIEATPGVRLLSRPEAGLVHFGAADAAPRFGPTLRARGMRGNVTRRPPGFIVCIGPERGHDDLDLWRGEIATALGDPCTHKAWHSQGAG
jgi:sphinganine-1-phosphate aldolase